jgi:hypothetical protein
MQYAVYCSGSIQKGTADTGKICWTDRERAAVAAGAMPVVLQFLNPDDPASDLADTAALFGRDMYQVKAADAVVVDARERRGIGIGIEMLASRVFGTLLVAVVPRDTYYRMSTLSYRGSTVTDYVHPHLAILADGIVDSFEAAGVWIRETKSIGTRPKGIDAVHDAIQAYESRMLPHDKPMLDILRGLDNDLK